MVAKFIAWIALMAVAGGTGGFLMWRLAVRPMLGPWLERRRLRALERAAAKRLDAIEGVQLVSVRSMPSTTCFVCETPTDPTVDVFVESHKLWLHVICYRRMTNDPLPERKPTT